MDFKKLSASFGYSIYSEESLLLPSWLPVPIPGFLRGIETH
jgi:hypothetical protein